MAVDLRRFRLMTRLSISPVLTWVAMVVSMWEAVGTILNELIEYTVVHFGFEEELIRFVRDRLLKHILKVDKELARELRGCRLV